MIVLPTTIKLSSKLFYAHLNHKKKPIVIKRDCCYIYLSVENKLMNIN